MFLVLSVAGRLNNGPQRELSYSSWNLGVILQVWLW